MTRLSIAVVVLAALPALAQHPAVLNSFHGPVHFDQADFAANATLRGADITNTSDRTVTSIQFGCFVVHVDGQITTVVGKDNPIRTGMQPGARLVFGHQTIAADVDDALELYYFVARVTYEDGTSWKAPLESLRHQIYMKRDTKKRPLTPA